MVKDISFYILFFWIIYTGFFTVTVKNLFKAGLYLALCLFGVAAIYILLDAEFLAATQVLIYIGGVVVLILVAIVLSESITGEKYKQYNEQRSVAALVVAVFFILIAKVIAQTSFIFKNSQINLTTENTQGIGRLLLENYLFAFEIISVLLLIAVIGAIVFVKRNLTNKLED